MKSNDALSSTELQWFELKIVNPDNNTRNVRQNDMPSYVHRYYHVACPMMTSSNGNIFRVTGPLCGEFTGPGEFPTQRPVTRSFAVFFDLRLNKRLSKQP